MTRRAQRAATLVALAVAASLAAARGGDARPRPAGGAGAPSDTGAPRRPRLADTADARDWRSYQRCGLDADSDDKARACFYWANRLDPSRPEPLYASYLLSHQKDTSLQTRAALLDPFIYAGRVIVVSNPQLGVFTGWERRGWLLLQAGDYFGSSRAFGEYLRRKPEDLDARWGAAMAMYYRRLYDSSAAQLAALEAVAHRRQEERTRSYLSLEFAHYARAWAHLAGARRDSARAALEDALSENLAFYHARMLLGEMALEDGDSTGAAEQWAAARELFGADVAARRRYARFLAHTGRPADAERELGAVLAADPDWVDARRELAEALDAQGDARRAEAARAYEEYLRRAPREPAEPRRAAEARLAALRPT